jgi:hypothetical protein
MVANSIITEALGEDPAHVVHLLTEVVKRCKAEARYTAEEIEVAAAQFCREFDIPHRLAEHGP